jgi:hypothetical protein
MCSTRDDGLLFLIVCEVDRVSFMVYYVLGLDKFRPAEKKKEKKGYMYNMKITSTPGPRAGTRACVCSNPTTVKSEKYKHNTWITSTGEKTRRPRTIAPHLAVGRAIVLEFALAAQHQLDIAHAAHATRLFAVDLTDTGFAIDGVGMRRAPCVFIDGARPLEEGRGLGVFSLLTQHVGQTRLCNAASSSPWACNTKAKLLTVTPTSGWLPIGWHPARPRRCSAHARQSHGLQPSRIDL